MANKYLYLIFLIIFNFNVHAKVKGSYYEFGVKNGSWGLLGDDEGIEFKDQIFKSVNISLDAEDFVVGLFIDMGEDSKKAKSLGANIGFKDWGLYYESGKVNGNFVSNSRLDIQNSGEFINDYTYVAFYSPTKYGNVGGESGFGYVEYTMPLQSEYNYGSSNTIVFVDPAAKITNFGYYMAFDALKNYMEYGKTGFALTTRTIIGFGLTKPSDRKDAALKSAAGTIKVEKEAELNAAAVSTFRYGFITALKNDKYNYGFEIGYEFRMHGTIMSLGDADLNYQINPGNQFNFLYGPYIRFAMKL